MILLKAGWSNQGMLSVSEAILQRQQAYYDTLYETQGQAFRQEVDVTPFVEFHSQVLGTTAATLEGIAIAFNRTRQSFVERAEGMLNARQALALLFMMDVAPLSSSAYAELTSASQSAALADLNQMMQRGVVERIGQGRTTRYMVNRKLRRLVQADQEASPPPGPAPPPRDRRRPLPRATSPASSSPLGALSGAGVWSWPRLPAPALTAEQGWLVAGSGGERVRLPASMKSASRRAGSRRPPARGHR